MLSALVSKLQDRNVRLAQLIGEKVGHFETFGDVVSNDSLKCELIFAASSRALRCVKATMTVDEATGYCLARARNCAVARRSGQAPERNSGVDLSDISSCACASLLGCGLETGNLVECILFGGLVDSESLWLFRRRCAFLALHNGIRVHALCPSCNSCPSSDPNKDWFERLVLRRGYLPTMGFSSLDKVKFFK